jgi:hypothetical protein
MSAKAEQPIPSGGFQNGNSSHPQLGPGVPILILILILISSCLTLPVNAAPAAPPTDLLQFLNGAVLHGSFKGMDTNSGLRWQHPDAKSPFAFQPAHIDFVRFAQSQPMNVSSACQFHFANGDDLFGSLVSLGPETMEFKTWFGETMKIPRAAIQNITFLPKNYSLIYEGPGDASEWVIGNGGQGRVVAQNGNFPGGFVIVGGGMVNIGGVTYTSGSQSGAPPWTYRDGAFVNTGQGTLGRDFHLTQSSTIEFDLASTGPFSLMVNLYSPALDKVDLNNGSLGLALDNNISFRRPRSTWAPRDLGSASLPDFDKHGSAHITLHCNKEEGSVSLLQDGVEIQRWTDIGNFDAPGGGVVFINQYINQFNGASLKLSHFKVSQWEGRNEPDFAAVSVTNTDTVAFVNRDRACAKVESITDGKLNLQLAGHLLHIPAERVKAISFAQSSAAAEPRGPWEVRAVFPGGGSVSFQLEKWDGRAVSGRSALFGSLAFPTGSIRQLQFNLDHPKADTALSLENDYDVLDQ